MFPQPPGTHSGGTETVTGHGFMKESSIGMDMSTSCGGAANGFRRRIAAGAGHQDQGDQSSVHGVTPHKSNLENAELPAWVDSISVLPLSAELRGWFSRSTAERKTFPRMKQMQ